MSCGVQMSSYLINPMVAVPVDVDETLVEL
jgi:hypothetical protein